MWEVNEVCGRRGEVVGKECGRYVWVWCVWVRYVGGGVHVVRWWVRYVVGERWCA